MHTLDYRLIIGSIDLPRSWKDLIEVVFEEDGRVKGSNVVAKSGYAPDTGDPEPYQDDRRVFVNKLIDGSTVYTHLSSGQGNYWAEYDIQNSKLDIDTTVGPLESFSDVEHFSTEGRKYVLSVNWT